MRRRWRRGSRSFLKSVCGKGKCIGKYIKFSGIHRLGPSYYTLLTIWEIHEYYIVSTDGPRLWPEKSGLFVPAFCTQPCTNRNAFQFDKLASPALPWHCAPMGYSNNWSGSLLWQVTFCNWINIWNLAFRPTTPGRQPLEEGAWTV